jgi:hypothetical protein
MRCDEASHLLNHPADNGTYLWDTTLESLARLRGFSSIAGLPEMQEAGCLAFCDTLTDLDEDGRWKMDPSHRLGGDGPNPTKPVTHQAPGTGG